MDRALTLEEYLAAPVGRYLAGPTWMHIYANEHLCGFVLWGRPSEEEMQRLARALLVELRPSAKPHASLIDARRVEAIDPGTFRVLSDYVAEHRAALESLVTHLAIVRPGGLMGAVAAGFYKVLSPPYPFEVFPDPASALAWLGRTKENALLHELDRIHDELTEATPLLRDLRGLLEARLSGITLNAAARQLALSERMLQRRLRDEGTTFQGELNAARVRVAKRLLIDSDTKLARVAFDVGCASPQHFSVLFRKLTGESPSLFRARHRARA